MTLAGYPIAAVVATDRYAARDAAALIEVDYEPLPTVISAEKALEADAPILWPELGTNVAYHFVEGGGDVEGTLIAGSNDGGSVPASTPALLPASTPLVVVALRPGDGGGPVATPTSPSTRPPSTLAPGASATSQAAST